MITTNAQFDEKNAALGKKPIYALTISGLNRVYTTHDLTAEGVTGVPANYRAWLKTPRGATQSIDVLEGTSSIGELECEVIDPDTSVRALTRGTNVIEGRRMTLSVGYPGMAYGNFVVLHTYVITKLTPSKTYTSWLFRARDRQMALKRTIYAHPENGYALSDTNPWVLQGTPSEIVQAIYLFGLRRDSEELDLDGMRALDSGAENLYKTQRPFFFRMTEAFEVKAFLESEIYKVCGMYCVVDNLGRLSLRVSRPPASGVTPVATFDESNTTVLPGVDRMEVMNEIVWKIDGGNREVVYIEGESVGTFGRAKQITIESKGLKTALGAQAWCATMSRRLFNRFAGTPRGLKGGAPTLQVQAFFLTLPVWVGDFVYVTHTKMPDMLTGVLGITQRIYEVVDRNPDYANGRMQYKLLDTGLTGMTPAYRIAPDARPFVIGTSTIF